MWAITTLGALAPSGVKRVGAVYNSQITPLPGVIRGTLRTFGKPGTIAVLGSLPACCWVAFILPPLTARAQVKALEGTDAQTVVLRGTLCGGG